MADHGKVNANTTPVVRLQKQGGTARHVARAVLDDIVRKLDPNLLADLGQAALSPDATACKAAVLKAVDDGVRPEDIADFYIPALARDMGDRWCVDQLSFAGVTIGVSRLQAMLRALGPHWSGDRVAGAGAPAILLLVADGAFHTLGSLVLSGQLRRKGMSVKLMLGAKPQDVAKLLSRTSFDAVFVSSSQGETLESLRQIIDVVKTSAGSSPPVVVGGTILDTENKDDLTTLTGADHATRNTDEALRFCGLLNNQNVVKIKTGG